MIEKSYEMKFPNQCRRPLWYGITTNGYVRTDGRAVMGRGIAKQAADAYPWLPRLLGTWLSEANDCFFIPEHRIFTFPVKHRWNEDADLPLIDMSAMKLKRVAESFPLDTFILPRPGCGNGRLNYDHVRPLLLKLPDNVWVVDRPK